jgi:hypothetical protein
MRSQRASNEAKLSVEVLALRQQVQVLERQIKRVRWEPIDRMILAALRERQPRSSRARCWFSCLWELHRAEVICTSRAWISSDTISRTSALLHIDILT